MTEIQFDLLNLNTFLIVGIILLVGGYLYYEIHKMKVIVNDIHYQVQEHASYIKSDRDVYPINVKDIPQETIPIVQTRDMDPVYLDEPINVELHDTDMDMAINTDMDMAINTDMKTDMKTEMETDNQQVDQTWNDLDRMMNTDPKMTETVNDDTDYGSMTVSQLKGCLIKRSLPTSGNKTKLIHRIMEASDLSTPELTV